MENNGKGMSIFYGVIGVATLIITIIGATFAYFSASINSAENAATAQGATLKLAFDEDASGHKENLIPIDVTLPEFNTGPFVGAGENDCKDINGNFICSVYEFTIENPSDSPAAQRVYGSIKPSVNTFSNFKIAVFKGTIEDVKNNTRTHEITRTVVNCDAANWKESDFDHKTQICKSRAEDFVEDGLAPEGTPVTEGQSFTWSEKVGFDVDGTAIEAYTTDYEKETDLNKEYTTNAADAERKHVIANKGDLVLSAVDAPAGGTVNVPAWEQVLDKGEKMIYTIVMWIPETGTNQKDDQGKSFAAGVYFTTEGSGTGVTGVLSTTSK